MTLGVLHPDRLLEELDAVQIAEWMAYFAAEPWGEERADLRMAQLCQLIANVNRDPRRTRPYKLEDFLPDFTGERRKSRKLTSAEEVKEVFIRLAGGGQ